MCWLHMRGFAAPEALRAGDLVVVPGDQWHMLSPEIELAGEEMLHGFAPGDPSPAHGGRSQI